MNFNQIKSPDINNLHLQDLKEEYLKLFDQYQNLTQMHDADNQQIYELKRNLKTATAAQAYLTQELEQLSFIENVAIEQVKHKLGLEIDELKRKCSHSEADRVLLEQNIEVVRNECAQLNCKVKSLQKSSTIPIIVNNTEHLELQQKLENENLALLAKIDEYQADINKFIMGIAEREEHINILKDQVACFEENLKSKRKELDEKSELLESAQEQITEMNAKIAMLKLTPENNDRKGNSLFAEVDDQRQAMKEILSAQKRHYIQMKKEYNEREFEIRRLKRENSAMHSELQICTSLFVNADKVYKDKLNKRITYLINQNTNLEKQLSLTHEQLVALANEKGINWLDSILDFCKQETEGLKLKLRSCLIEKGLLDEDLRKTQQDMAKWRFETLKARCLITDRESLLEENNIKFKTFTPTDFKISNSEIEEAKPNINIGIQKINITNIDDIEFKECATKSLYDSIHNPLEKATNYSNIGNSIHLLLEQNEVSKINEKTLNSSNTSLSKDFLKNTKLLCSDIDVTLSPGDKEALNRTQLSDCYISFCAMSPIEIINGSLSETKKNLLVTFNKDNEQDEQKHMNLTETNNSNDLIQDRNLEYNNFKPLSPAECKNDTVKIEDVNLEKKQPSINEENVKIQSCENTHPKQVRTKPKIIIRKIVIGSKKKGE